MADDCKHERCSSRDEERKKLEALWSIAGAVLKLCERVDELNETLTEVEKNLAPSIR